MQARFFSEGKELTKQIIKALKKILNDTDSESSPSSKSSTSSLPSVRSKALGLILWLSAKSEAHSKKIKPSAKEIEIRNYLERVQKLYKEAAIRTDGPVDNYVLPIIMDDFQSNRQLASIRNVRAIVGSFLCLHYLHTHPVDFNQEVIKQRKDHWDDPLFTRTDAKIRAALHFIAEYKLAEVVAMTAEVEKSPRVERRY